MVNIAHMPEMTGLDLKLKRVAADVLGIEVARKMGVTPSRVSYIEGRRHPHSSAVVESYLAALDKCITKTTAEGAA